MIDIHSHLLYGIDDGSKSIEASVSIIQGMAEVGFTDIILTPHYINNSKYDSDRNHNLKLMTELKKALKSNNINVNLYIGNEIYMDQDIYELLENDLISSLSDSRYLLIELPMNGEFPNYIDIFEDLINRGYKVILAHPERYISFQNDFDKIYELEDIGIYFQCNYESILGSYGKGAIKTVKRLFKEKMVSYIATDIHHEKRDYKKFLKAKKKIRKYLSEKEFNIISEDNPRKIIS